MNFKNTFIQARKECQPPNLCGIDLDADTRLWYLPSEVKHPFRDIIGEASFYLLECNVGPSKIALLPVECLLIDTPSTAAINTQQWLWPNNMNSFCPLKYQHARRYLSCISEAGVLKETEEISALFVYCTTADMTDRMLLGIHHIENKGFERKIDQITRQGQMTSKEALKSIVTLMDSEKQSLMFSGTFDIVPPTSVNNNNNNNTTISTSATNELSIDTTDTDDGNTTHSKHWLWPSYTQCELLVLTIQMASCSVDSEENDVLSVLSNQLNRCIEWCTSIKANAGMWQCSTNSSDTVPFTQRVEQFLLSYARRDSSAIADIIYQSCNFSTPITNASIKLRELDFTEQLWQLCQMANDQEEIADAIYAVLEEVRSGRVQPTIHHYNRTTLANLIRDARRLNTMVDAVKRRQQLETITLEAEQCVSSPLSCITAVGLVKLQQDYIYYLSGADGELVSPSSLESLFGPSLLSNSQALLTRLQVAHRIMALVEMLRMHLPLLSRDTLRLLIHGLFTRVAHEMACIGRKGTSRNDDKSAAPIAIPVIDWTTVTLCCRLAIPRLSSTAKALIRRLSAIG
ncbi:hypothetical protein BDF19DRAFT_419144 [Syncephalis fuscata]|nr:hypothetical protein BDF19DRAFT_419144 [Syncephalis fuscata]